MEMEGYKIKATVGLVCAAIGGTVCSVLGGWDMLLKALVIMVALDYASGLLAAFVEKTLNSEVRFKGVAKKVLIFILVAVAFNIDQTVGTTIIRTAVISFYIGIEGLSVLKNAGRAGLPVPDVLAKALEEIQKKSSNEVKEERQ
ncbi:phage holin family protein [Pelotomaculum terephthalicicum JT]|uniref:phage holin family protein n=1 Tax=Pelotomaculum TaxID=191373 RepID=UPI0009CD1005|nr:MULTISPECIES: phage holin family protein [Pelotomaculum]MCG9966883.1 phage holin family protein [Pelotomaculum terephthalicicum JT]OPX87972.1 MAG: Holin family protein [Pelotomaculum sp. PtaB.Bin117]OPY59003.1 MAG: Holin family protein [Pelotomaculum sp. PtaU1.Bin065]